MYYLVFIIRDSQRSLTIFSVSCFPLHETVNYCNQVLSHLYHAVVHRRWSSMWRSLSSLGLVPDPLTYTMLSKIILFLFLRSTKYLLKVLISGNLSWSLHFMDCFCQSIWIIEWGLFLQTAMIIFKDFLAHFILRRQLMITHQSPIWRPHSIQESKAEEFTMCIDLIKFPSFQNLDSKSSLIDTELLLIHLWLKAWDVLLLVRLNETFY